MTSLLNCPILGVSTAASAVVLSNTTPVSVKPSVKSNPQVLNPAPSIGKDAEVDNSVTVSLSDDNIWVDIMIPKKCEGECRSVIKTICESHQNLWRYGYSGSREERAAKIAQGKPPESIGFRGRVTYTITPGHKAKSESTCHIRCGFFQSSAPLPESELTPPTTSEQGTTDPPPKELSYPECLKDVVSDFQTALTKVISKTTKENLNLRV